MNLPLVVAERTFQSAWISAARIVQAEQGDLHNLIVQVSQPDGFDQSVHDRVTRFARANGLLSPLQVADTIFPSRFYRGLGTAADLYHIYNRERGVYARTRNMSHRGWGTYFRRMTNYSGSRGIVNQLDKVIQAINSRTSTYRAAYSILIPQPGQDTARAMGSPCLNYVAVQMQPGQPPAVGLLCVYRNHDFVQRAYGNYWGLCRLLQFIAAETGSAIGPLTCVSSHAYIGAKKRELNRLLATC